MKFQFLYLLFFSPLLHGTYYSQKGQDQWVIEEVFNHKKDGFFVDLAASDGIVFSNTYTLESEYGWIGICIEPNPDFFAKLEKNRASINLTSCIDGSEGTVEFIPSMGELGGIIDIDTDNCPNYRTKKIRNARKAGTILKLQTKTLEQVLQKHSAPSVIDYMSLDVEGAETRIMRDFPFEKYTFLALTIERPTPELNKLLFANGYLFVKNVRYDTFYIHKSHPNAQNIPCDPFKQIPKKKW